MAIEAASEPGSGDAPSAEEPTGTLDADKKALTDRLLRLAAEFENWKKRVDRERVDDQRRARVPLLLDLLGVVDGLERALASLSGNPDPKAVRDGVALVLREAEKTLDRHGVDRVEAVGQKFDPRFHDAVAKVPQGAAEPGTVVSEVQKGYLLDGRLLRPASVVVAEAAPPANVPQDGQPKPQPQRRDGT